MNDDLTPPYDIDGKPAHNSLMRHAFVNLVEKAIHRSRKKPIPEGSPNYWQSEIAETAEAAIRAVANTGKRFAWGTMQLYQGGKLVCNCPATEAAVAYSCGNFMYQFDTLVKERLNVGDASRGVIEVW